MIEISLYVLLIIYGIVLLLYFIFVAINLYHLFQFGFLSYLSFMMTFILFAGIILILFITYKLGAQIDWAQTFII